MGVQANGKAHRNTVPRATPMLVAASCGHRTTPSRQTRYQGTPVLAAPGSRRGVKPPDAPWRAALAGGIGTIPGIELASEAGRACAADVRWACPFAEAIQERRCRA